MAKLTPISGFPEWLPEQKLLEDTLIQRIKKIYSSHGFVPIETPAVELIDTLASKGVVDREIYVVKRLHADEDEEAALGLHFDLTVPFARYVSQHFGKLQFPFKRYQLQKVWRGERPQKGRFREFYQFDIDTIAREDLPISCDAEIITMMLKAFESMQLGNFIMMVNSRKILHGCYSSFGLDEEKRKKAITAVDKINKIGEAGVIKELTETVGIREDIAGRIVSFGTIKVKPQNLGQKLSELNIDDAQFRDGISELEAIFALIPKRFYESIELDLSLARGLDYYTGVVFEIQLCDHREFGTVSSGGRYENLTAQFTAQKLPGVGGSIGISRLMDLIISKALLPLGAKSTAKALIAVYQEDQRLDCEALAEDLRKHNVPTEVYFKSPKLGKQIEYAETKGMRYILFINHEDKSVQVKDLETKQQISISSVPEWVNSLGMGSYSSQL